MYCTLCLKMRHAQLHIMPHMSHNSCKYGPILIILSLSHSHMNCRKRLNNIYTTTPEICCRTTVRKLNVQLCNFTARTLLKCKMWCRTCVTGWTVGSSSSPVLINGDMSVDRKGENGARWLMALTLVDSWFSDFYMILGDSYVYI